MSALDTIKTTTSPDTQNVTSMKTALEALKSQGKIAPDVYEKIKKQLGNLESLSATIQQEKFTLQKETIELGELKNKYDEKRIAHNKTEIDRQLKEKEKELLAARAALAEAKKTTAPQYGDKARKYLTDQATKAGKKKKIDEEVIPTVRRMNPVLKYLALASGVGASIFAGSGFERDEQGKLEYDFNKLVEVAVAPLPDVQEQWAKRKLVKMGVYEIKEAELEYQENPNALKNDTPVTEVAAPGDSPALKELKERVAKLEYFKQITYTQKLAEVIDYKASANRPKGELLKLWSYRNQWANEEGFAYIPTPNKGNVNGKHRTYANVQGIGHFLLDCDVTQGQRPIDKDINSDPDHYVHSNNAAFFRIAKENNDYVPVFTREGERIRVHYERYNEVSEGEKIMSPLRQFKFDDISFGETRLAEGFLTAQEVLLKKGAKNNYRHDGDQRGTYLIYSGNTSTYSQFSGSSVVFIFEDHQGNRIIRDFAGSINDIQKEGQAIKAEFKLADGALTMGIHDVGSFSAKPVAPNGIYATNQSEGYNWSDATGGGLLIPNSQY